MHLSRNLPNGYTVSVIDDGYGNAAAPYEAWYWETASGYSPEQPTGWLTDDEACAYIERVEQLPTVDALMIRAAESACEDLPINPLA